MDENNLNNNESNNQDQNQNQYQNQSQNNTGQYYNNTPQYNNSSQYNDNIVGGDEKTSVMTMGEWLITLIVCLIPCVNIIMLFVWGFGDGNQNRKNYARAQLIMVAVCMVLGFVFLGVIWASLVEAFRYGYYY